MAFHFTLPVFNYNVPDGDTPATATAVTREFNNEWVAFEALSTEDPKYTQGRRTKVNYFPGGNPATAITYYTDTLLAACVTASNPPAA